jgi:TolB-like protein/tetratricopeptide (TPR) repeat protein
MKRCPECRRDYYDDTLLYCLEDGTALIQGPVPSPDEPQTAILHETAPPQEAATRAQIHTTEQTAVPQAAEAEPQKSLGEATERHSLSAHRAAKPLIAAVVALAVLVGGYFAYRFLAPTKQIESIAVMPFVNETGNADREYLSDGMTETLIKGLTSLPMLNVKPRSSVFRYKGKDTDLQTIGRELNVQVLLNGRVAQRGDQLTLSLELVDVQNDKVLWTEQYQRNQSELVSLQSEIAKDVSNHIKSRLTGSEERSVTKAGTSDPEAYQAYLKGRYYWNRRTSEDINKAIEQFKIAADIDPNYALAFAGLGDCYAVLSEYSGIPNSETVPKAQAYAERAIAIDPQLAEPHATLGSNYQQLWHWSESEKAYKRAIEINPSYPTAYHWYSLLLKELGRNREAEAAISRAHELDPLSSVIGLNIAELYIQQGNFDASIETCHKIIEIAPAYPAAYEGLAVSYMRKRMFPEALAAAEKAVELSKRAGVTLGSAGHVFAVAGERAKAIAIVKELEDKYLRREASGFDIASVYAGLGDKDKAFGWLEKDFGTRNGKLQQIRWEVEFEPLRDDSRFKDLLKRMNLPE